MSANEAMLRSVLTLTALLTVPALTQASSYSHVCATPTNYQGSAEYATGVTCDQAMASFTGAGQALHNDDFSNAFDCGGKAQNVYETVHAVAAKCCGTGSEVSRRSACWFDYSHVCKTSSDYDANAEYETNADCDKYMDYLSSENQVLQSVGESFSSAFDCGGKSQEIKSAIDGVASKCCGSSGKSACFKNHAYACTDPNDWLPDKTYSGAETSESTMKCTQILEAYTSLENEDLTKSWSCNGEPEAIRRDLQDIIAAKMGCCGSSKKSACWVDRSNVCADPSKFLPWNNFKSEDGSFDGTCDFAVHTISKDNTASCHGEDFSQTWSCSAKSSCQAQLLELARGGCCGSAGQSASACHGHYSGVGSFNQVGIFAISIAVAIALA